MRNPTRQPHEYIAEDMARDMMIQLRAVDEGAQKIFENYTEPLSEFARHLAPSVEPTVVNQSTNDETDYQIINKKVTIAAQKIGDIVLSHMRLFDANSSYRSQSSLSGFRLDGEEISPNEWMAKVWAPDYADRFASAATETYSAVINNGYASVLVGSDIFVGADND